MFVYLFIYETEREKERERQAEGENQGSFKELDAELDPRTLGSHPEPKADAQPLGPLGAPAGALSNRRRKEHPSLLSVYGVWLGLTPMIQTPPILSSHLLPTRAPTTWTGSPVRPSPGLLQKLLGKRTFGCWNESLRAKTEAWLFWNPKGAGFLGIWLI